MGDRPPTRVTHPVADVAAFLRGAWVHRPAHRRLDRTALLARSPALPSSPCDGDAYSWVEAGELQWATHTRAPSTTHKAGRRLLLAVRPAVPCVVDVSFDDGGSSTVPICQSGTDTFVHGCPPDTYYGSWTVDSADQFRLTWDVEGPAKQITIRSTYYARLTQVLVPVVDALADAAGAFGPLRHGRRSRSRRTPGPPNAWPAIVGSLPSNRLLMTVPPLVVTVKKTLSPTLTSDSVALVVPGFSMWTVARHGVGGRRRAGLDGDRAGADRGDRAGLGRYAHDAAEPGPTRTAAAPRHRSRRGRQRQRRREGQQERCRRSW